MEPSINARTATTMPMTTRRTRRGTREIPDFSPFVARGVALLNMRVPGWGQAVEMKTLELASPTSCVVGQLAIKAMLNGPLVGYYDGIKKLFRGARNKERAAAEHGFNVPTAYVVWLNSSCAHLGGFDMAWAWDELTMLWTEEIRAARRAARTAKAKAKMPAIL